MAVAHCAAVVAMGAAAGRWVQGVGFVAVMCPDVVTVVAVAVEGVTVGVAAKGGAPAALPQPAAGAGAGVVAGAGGLRRERKARTAGPRWWWVDVACCWQWQGEVQQ
mmetsp:Transcript_37246/g.93901  ORF Transcript_37246/g.93901 Transcript_37246/m.93901 type:complete len:107 (+) Transcript_37246:461-781(+)